MPRTYALIAGVCLVVSPWAAAQEAERPTEGFGEQIEAVAEGASAATKAIALIDNFESGLAPGWHDPVGGGTGTIESFGANGTDHSLRIDGGMGSYDMWYDMFSWQPTSVSLYVRSSSTSADDTYVVLGDDNTRFDNGAIFFFAEGNSEFTVLTNGTSYSCGFYNPFTWYRVNFTVDWACKVFDVYIDGSLRQYNLPFRNSSVDAFTQVHVLNFDDSTGWWDEITMSSPPGSPFIFGDGFERASTCRWSSTAP